MNLHEIYSAAQLVASKYGKLSECKSAAMLNRSTLGYTAKNLLKNTAASQTKNGVTFTVNADGSVTVNGKAAAKTDFVVFIGAPAESMYDAVLTLSGCPQNGSAETYRTFIQDMTSEYVTLATDNGNGADLTLSRSVSKIRCFITIYEGYTAENLTFYPMLRYADITDDTYEPYKPSIDERLAALESPAANTLEINDADVYNDVEETI